jgi:hypothetical protein
MEAIMKKLFDQALTAARAKPVRFASIVLMLLVMFAIGVSLRDPMGQELYLLTR